MDKERFREIIRFVIAGIAGFAVELVVLICLKENLGIDTLIATPIAFILSVIVNYILCANWVFNGAKQQDRRSKIAFFLTSAIGLILNEVLMLLFRVVWGEVMVLVTVYSFTINIYVLNKVLSTCCVMIWNYFAKRLILTRQHADGKQENHGGMDDRL